MYKLIHVNTCSRHTCPYPSKTTVYLIQLSKLLSLKTFRKKKSIKKFQKVCQEFMIYFRKFLRIVS